MRVPTPILRTTYHWAAALFSVLFAIVVVAAFVPSSALQSVLLLAYAGGVVAVALGALEELAVALLTLSTRARPRERELLEPAAALLTGTEVDLDRLRVGRVESTEVVVSLGRSPWVVVAPRLLDDVRERRVTPARAAALLVRAEGRRRLTSRTHLAWLLASAPWRGLTHAIRGLGRALAWIPFGAISWRCRGLLAPICLVQSIAGGRTALGIFTVLIIGLSYAVPAAERALSRRADAAADQAVAALEHLVPERHPLPPAIPGTTQAHPSQEQTPARPHLTLVRS